MNFIGKIKLINTKTNELVRAYSYDKLSGSVDGKKYLKNLLNTGNFKLVCGCSDKDIEYKISNNFRLCPCKQNEVHYRTCPKSKEYLNFKSKYNSGWKKEEESEDILVTLGFSLNPNKKEPLQNNLDPLNKNKIYDINTVNQGKITILSLITHLNLKAWETSIKRDESIPSDKLTFLKQIYGTANSVKIKGINKNLNELYFNFKRDKNMSSNEFRFVYGYLDKVEQDLYKADYRQLKIKDSFGRTFSYKISLEKLENAYEFPKQKSEDKIAVGGFICRKGKSFEFFNIALMNVNEYGLFSESSHEIDFYNLLCDNNILFYKPYEHLLEYNGCIPDGIIETGNKTIFIEVFGFNTKDYLENREEKIKLIENLKETHLMLKWDAFNNSPMPTISEINNIINENN